MPLRSLFVLALAALALLTTGCEEKRAASMVLRPAGPFTFDKTNDKRTIKLAFFDQDDKPFVRKPDAVFDADDPTVVTVEASADGTSAVITPKRSGKAKVKVTAFGLEKAFEVEVHLVGGVEFDKATPAKMRIGDKPHQLVVHVKDDRGNPMEAKGVNYSASDYCVDVDREGLVTPQAVGMCSVEANVAGKTATHTFDIQ